MNAAETWFYMQELKRKTSVLENDIERIDQQLARPNLDRQTRHRLKLDRDYHMIRLSKLKRGLLY